jgi:hypothetical protein
MKLLGNRARDALREARDTYRRHSGADEAAAAAAQPEEPGTNGRRHLPAELRGVGLKISGSTPRRS